MGVGAFHNPPRAKYSEETRNLIKLLMEESKVGMMQRKAIQKAIDKGESLPPPRKSAECKKKAEEPQVMFPSIWKKRSQNMIVGSGAYEREQYRRTAPLPNREKQKRHLACLMAYGKEMPETPHGPKILHKARRELKLPPDDDPFEHIIEGIRERMEFLNDMECLGMGKKYRPIIQQEIAQKIRLMESIDKERSSDVRKELDKFKQERPPPKPFPLGDLDES
ncbi:hypothetical protein KPH14_003290 [Odynerus spinipes]|uniref:Uncharacterized protein n=1 Tax=Odynerus spinipes TaxID=1348599 RepID=A0AAD9VJQ4_9HYME|nr:hypothetical protein KPH14_003290 [Odynerus spinipes]